MKLSERLPAFLVFFLLFFLSGSLSANQASAALLKLSPSSGTVSQGTQVQVLIDTESTAVDSAVAVVTYDTTKVEITNIASGTFFDSVATDSSVNGEVSITGTLNMGTVGGKTGSGTLATITIAPKISTGSFSIGFRCNATDIDDSNIMETGGTNLLATVEQCSKNVEGSYTIGSSSTGGATSVPTQTPTQANTNDTKGGQPSLPEELPQSGPANWLKAIVTGLAMIGIGLLLL